MKKRKKISILNILFALLILSLITSLVFKNRENLQNIFTNKNKIKMSEVSSSDKLEIGDIVYYDHKRAANSANEIKQTVTISSGDSSHPGAGYREKEENKTITVHKWKEYEIDYDYTYELKEEPVTTIKQTHISNNDVYTTYSYNESTGLFTLSNKKFIESGEFFYVTENGINDSFGSGTGRKLYKLQKYYDTNYIISITEAVVKTKTEKHRYIGEVESQNINEYPQNGMRYKNWYEYVGKENKVIKIKVPIKEDQIFNAKDYNTTWRVWDKLSDGRVVLVSNRTVTNISTYGAVGHIWWEHNAHKVASIFGYGEGADTNATIGTEYKVGSGIDNAPDMLEGDKGDWKIGEEPQDKINISAARSLILPEVEKKLGITDEGIKNKITSSGTNSSGPGYGVQTTTSMTYVVQKDIGSVNQDWTGGDRSKGKAKNKSYKMRDRYYYWNKESIPATKYKDMLFNGINSWTGLATNALDVSIGGSSVGFRRGYVGSSILGAYGYYLVYSSSSHWYEYVDSPSLRVAVYLKSKIKYLPAGANAWDIYEASSEDKDLKLKVLNLSSEPASKIDLEVGKASTVGVAPEDAIGRIVAKQEVDGKIEYTVKAKKFDGQKRDENTTGDNATFSKIDNKYNVEITGIPEGYDFKIIGKTGKQIDLDTDTNLEYELVIYPKAGTQNVRVEYVGGANDNTFAVIGNVVIKSGNEMLGRKDNVTLKIGVNSVPVDNVDLFDKTKNDIKEYTVEFEKSEDDKSLHTVAFDPDTKKLVVTYVSPKREITVSVAEDSKKYLTNITEIKLKLVGDGKETPVTLKPTEFTTKLNLPERDKDGNPINYSLQKVENIPGYYLSIDGFNVNLKPILKLPYTGTELSGKNIAIISLGIFGIALAFRFRKKLVLIFKEYTMMK